MDLINARTAEATTLLSTEMVRRDLFSKFEVCFNRGVNKAAEKERRSYALLWTEFDKNEEIIFEDDVIEELIGNVIAAGYDVAFCYNHPSDYNPCGFVIAWGPNPMEEINKFFRTNDLNLYRGE